MRTRLAVVTALATGTALVGPAPAYASPTLINCVGEVELDFSPGLTNTDQEVDYVGEDRGTACVSLTHPTLHSFVGPFNGTSVQSCATLLDGGEGTETLYWNGSSTLTSEWTYTYTSQQVGTAVVYAVNGPITAGVAAGATLNQVNIIPLADFAACSTPGGLQHHQGTSTWVFTGL
jgi:hypothetical protein